YSQRNRRGADSATRPLDDSRTRPLSSKTCWVNCPSRPLRPRVKLSSWSRAPASAALASRAIAANSQRCVRIMEGGPRNGWRKSAKRKLNKHFAHPVQGTTEVTSGGRARAQETWWHSGWPEKQWETGTCGRTGPDSRNRPGGVRGPSHDHSATGRLPPARGRSIAAESSLLGRRGSEHRTIAV